jgi:protoporphyrinogen oxidase
MVNKKYSELLNALDNHIKDKFTKVESEISAVYIEHHKVRLANNEEISYEHLISTIPLDIFQKSLISPMLSDLINELPSLLSKKELYYYPAPYTRMHGYDQLYVLDEDSPVLRFIRTSSGTIIKETFEKSSEEPLSVEPYGKLMVNNSGITGLDSFFRGLEAKNIYLAGRVAKWQSYHYIEGNINDVDEIIQKLIS